MGKKQERDKTAIMQIQDMAKAYKNKIGIRRIAMQLRSKGVIINTKKIARIKKEYDIPTKVRKAKPYNIKLKKDLLHGTAPNILNQSFDKYKPDNVYCTDITYLLYRGGEGYLSATKDIATKEIVAYNVNGNMNIETGLESIKRMLETNPESREAIIHSDQGVHYTHPRYVSLLKEYGIVQSMSRKGECIDNAPIESFWGHLKDEVEYEKCRSLSELEQTIDKYMDYYNNERCQWEINKMPPRKYREHLLNTA